MSAYSVSVPRSELTPRTCPVQRRHQEKNLFRIHNVGKLMLLTTAIALAVLAGATQAQKVAEEKQGGPARPRNEQTRSTEGAILRGDALLGSTVKTSDGKVAGEITDMVLDLDQGTVALVVITDTAEKGAKQEPAAIPFALLTDTLASPEQTLKLASDGLRTAPRLKDPERGATRKWTEGVYRHFEIAADPATGAESAPSQGSLVLISTLRHKEVKTEKGAAAGHIEGIAITTRGEIAYVGVATEEDAEQLYPVPLSAFVVLPGSSDWMLELPENILENTPTFPAKAWPKTIDRGWLEYVHVRYGRSTFAGVNREPHAKQARGEGGEVK